MFTSCMLSLNVTGSLPLVSYTLCLPAPVSVSVHACVDACMSRTRLDRASKPRDELQDSHLAQGLVFLVIGCGEEEEVAPFQDLQHHTPCPALCTHPTPSCASNIIMHPSCARNACPLVPLISSHHSATCSHPLLLLQRLHFVEHSTLQGSGLGVGDDGPALWSEPRPRATQTRAGQG